MARAIVVFLTLAAALSAAPLVAQACDGVGVITRIDGLPQEVVITRTDDGKATVVARPRVLEPICAGDLIHAIGATSVVVSVDGQGLVRVNRTTDYRVPPRSGAPSLAGNAYRTITDQVMPDMKRMPWNVRIKGGGDDFGFALSALSTGGQKLQAGRHDVLVRLVGGTPPYKVEIRSEASGLVASQASSSHDVVLAGVSLAPGDYAIRISDSADSALSAAVKVLEAPPPLDASYKDLADPEIRSAVTASALARSYPETWSFQAEQLIQAAPELGLDRDKVYELIESYTAQ